MIKAILLIIFMIFFFLAIKRTFHVNKGQIDLFSLGFPLICLSLINVFSDTEYLFLGPFALLYRAIIYLQLFSYLWMFFAKYRRDIQKGSIQISINFKRFIISIYIMTVPLIVKNILVSEKINFMGAINLLKGIPIYLQIVIIYAVIVLVVYTYNLNKKHEKR